MRVRPETFGAIVATEKPPALLYVNHAMARRLGIDHSPLWSEPERDYLSAPTGVRLAVTNYCPLRCQHCYVDAGAPLSGELSDGEIHGMLDVLAGMGVFHVTFSGGEPFSRPGVIEFAKHAREIGLVPNVATNGFYMTPDLARACRVFGQVNVSLDGVDELYKVTRGVDAFEVAERALKLLVEAGANVCASVVVSRRNIGHLAQLLRHVRRLGVRKAFIHRWKPVGRGRTAFNEMALEPAQHLRLLRRIGWASVLGRISITLDCSFTSLLCAAGASPSVLNALTVAGCEAGRTLAAISANGRLSACSFSRLGRRPAQELPSLWEGDEHFALFRERGSRLPESCRSCKYLSCCRGGCPAIAEAVTGDFSAPDPGCPIVATRRIDRCRSRF